MPTKYIVEIVTHILPNFKVFFGFLRKIGTFYGIMTLEGLLFPLYRYVEIRMIWWYRYLEKTLESFFLNPFKDGGFKLLIGLGFSATLLFYRCCIIALWHSHVPGKV